MELPFDVEMEILQRLAVKPLRRLERVSKRWRSLIRCRYFMERYLVHQKSKHRFKILANIMNPFARGFSRELPLFRLLDDDSEYSYLLIQSLETSCLLCDGVICCMRPNMAYLLINPSTGQRLLTIPTYSSLLQTDVTLPLTVRLHISHYRFIHSRYARLFPYPSSHLLGFGRDRVSREYKIVRLFGVGILREDSMVCTHCELLSVKTPECWRYISPVPVPCYDWQVSASVDGSIYWFTAYLWETESESGYSRVAKIIAFDLHTHRFRAVPHPHQFGAKKPSDIVQLMNLRDQVWIVEQTPDWSLEMWRSMDDHKGGAAWGKMYSIDLKSWATSYIEVFTPIEIYKDGKVLIKAKKPDVSTVLKERLLKYDPPTQTLLLSALPPFGLAPNFRTWVLAPYYQSLFSFHTN